MIMASQIQRYQDWPSRLSAFVAMRADEPFRWGVNDCALYAADAIHAMSGEDLAADFRGYEGREGAQKLLEQHGGLEALAEKLFEARGLPELETVLMARRGDVLLVDLDRLHRPARLFKTPAVQCTLAICTGAELAHPSFTSAARVPVISARRAWRV